MQVEKTNRYNSCNTTTTINIGWAITSQYIHHMHHIMIVLFEECIIFVINQSSFTNIDSFTIRSSIHVFINIEINHFRDHHVERVQTASQHDTSQVAPINDHRVKVKFQTYQTSGQKNPQSSFEWSYETGMKSICFPFMRFTHSRIVWICYLFWNIQIFDYLRNKNFVPNWMLYILYLMMEVSAIYFTARREKHWFVFFLWRSFLVRSRSGILWITFLWITFWITLLC